MRSLAIAVPINSPSTNHDTCDERVDAVSGMSWFFVGTPGINVTT